MSSSTLPNAKSDSDSDWLTESETDSMQEWLDSLDHNMLRYLYNRFRTIVNEVARSETMCTYCAEVDLRNQAWPVVDHDNYIYEADMVEVLYRAQYCWFCRFLCRVVADDFSLDEFCSFVLEDCSLMINTCSGGWEGELMLKLEADPLNGYSIELESMPDASSDKIFRFTSHPFTCFALASLPSRRCIDDISVFRRPFEHLQTLVEWLTFCKSHHSRCSGKQTGASDKGLDLLVVDVKERILCELPENAPYVALSYVWGKDPLTRRACDDSDEPAVLGDVIRKITESRTIRSQLPATIQDAFIVASTLGYRYLWVDLLCIDQDDIAEKERTIPMMDRIYGLAELTICVLDGDMFSGIHTAGKQPQYVQCRTNTQDHCYVYIQHGFESSQMLSQSAWASRAWTFQEGELSTRRLCFSENAIFMVCREEIFHHSLSLDHSESRVKGVPDTGAMQYLSLSFDLDMPSWMFDQYARLTYSYTSRTISFAADACKAVQGALRRITQNLGITFVAALPLDDIHNALSWQCRVQWQIAGEDIDSAKSSAGGRRLADFPSWSWVAWDETVQYHCWLQNCVPSDRNSEQIYSLVTIDDNSLLFFDAVKVRTRARIMTTDLVRVGPFPAIVIESSAVTLDIAYDQKFWHVLDTNGEPIDQGSAYTHYDQMYMTPSVCSFELRKAASKDLVDAGTRSLEFILIQEWHALTTTRPPVPLHRPNDPERIRSTNIDFEDTVWAMAVTRNDDGHAERVAVVCIPSRAWYAASPKPCMVTVV